MSINNSKKNQATIKSKNHVSNNTKSKIAATPLPIREISKSSSNFAFNHDSSPHIQTYAKDLKPNPLHNYYSPSSEQLSFDFFCQQQPDFAPQPLLTPK
jgi:hypothetical protein